MLGFVQLLLAYLACCYNNIELLSSSVLNYKDVRKVAYVVVQNEPVVVVLGVFLAQLASQLWCDFDILFAFPNYVV